MTTNITTEEEAVEKFKLIVKENWHDAAGEIIDMNKFMFETIDLVRQVFRAGVESGKKEMADIAVRFAHEFIIDKPIGAKHQVIIPKALYKNTLQRIIDGEGGDEWP